MSSDKANLAKVQEVIQNPQTFQTGGSTHAIRLLECQNQLGEGIIYNDETNNILWTDINAKEFHSLDLTSGSHVVIDKLPKMLGSFAMRPKGERGYLCAWEDGFQLYDFETKEALSEFSVGEAVNPHGLPTRMNDGRTDPSGKFYISGAFYGGIEGMYVKVFKCTTTPRFIPPNNVDSVISLNHVELVDKVQVTNSISFSPDGKTMYLADSPTSSIHKYLYDGESGTLSNKQLVRKLTNGVPDGSCVDSSGNIWNALWRNGEGPSMVNCIDPNTGDILYVVHIPDGTSQITCCCFGGPDLDVLFISTASCDKCDLEKEPWAGSVYAVRIEGVKGRLESRFIGNL